MAKKRFLLLDDKDYQTVVNLCDKSGIKNANGDISWYFHWLTFVVTLGIVAVVLTVIKLLN